VLRQRPRHGDRAGADLLSVHDADVWCLAALSIVVFVVLAARDAPRSSAATAGGSRNWKRSTFSCCCFGMGGLAVWAGSRRFCPRYIIGIVLAGTVGKGPRPGAPLEDHDVRAADAVLIHPGRVAGVGGSRGGGPSRVPCGCSLRRCFQDDPPAAHHPVVRLLGRDGVYYTLMMSTG